MIQKYIKEIRDSIYWDLLQFATNPYYNLRQLALLQNAIMWCYIWRRVSLYYKMRQVLLQNATGVTKCDVIIKCDSTHITPHLHSNSFRTNSDLLSKENHKTE